jgi:hypothetical protein
MSGSPPGSQFLKTAWIATVNSDSAWNRFRLRTKTHLVGRVVLDELMQTPAVVKIEVHSQKLSGGLLAFSVSSATRALNAEE